MSCGFHLACVGRATPGAGESDGGFARLDAVVPSRLAIVLVRALEDVRGPRGYRDGPHKRSVTVEVMAADVVPVPAQRRLAHADVGWWPRRLEMWG